MYTFDCAGVTPCSACALMCTLRVPDANHYSGLNVPCSLDADIALCIAKITRHWRCTNDVAVQDTQELCDLTELPLRSIGRGTLCIVIQSFGESHGREHLHTEALMARHNN